MNETPEQQAIHDKREALEIEERAREAEERQRLAERNERAGRRRRGWTGPLSGLLGAAGGAVLGGYLGHALAGPPADFDGTMIADNVVAWTLGGAIIGFFSGLLVGLTVWWASAEVWEWWRRHQ
jgi:hypothetical protein